MKLLFIVTLFINYLYASGNPVLSVYNRIKTSSQDPSLSCPELRKNSFIESQPDFLSKCPSYQDLLEVSDVVSDNNLELCLLYYSNVMSLCKAMPDKLPQFGITNENVKNETKNWAIHDVCPSILENTEPFAFDEVKTQVEETLKKLNSRVCTFLCSNDDYTIKQECLLNAYMIKLALQLNLIRNTKFIKPPLTERVNSQDAPQEPHYEEPTPKEVPVKSELPLVSTQNAKGSPKTSLGNANTVNVTTAENKEVQVELTKAPADEIVKTDIGGVGDAQKPANNEPAVVLNENKQQEENSQVQNTNEQSQNNEKTIPVVDDTEKKSSQQPNLAIKTTIFNGGEISNAPVDKKETEDVKKQEEMIKPEETKKPEEVKKTEEVKKPDEEKKVTEPELKDVVSEKKSALENPGDDFSIAGEKPSTNVDKPTVNQPEKQPDTNPDIEETPADVGAGMDDYSIPLDNIDYNSINPVPPKENPKSSEVKTQFVNTKPQETNDEDVGNPANYQNQNIDDSDSYFFSYFMMVCIMFICAYVAYHNKQKILALVVEGRRGRRTSRTRRPNSANYRKLDSNLEEAVTSSCTKNTTQIIY